MNKDILTLLEEIRFGSYGSSNGYGLGDGNGYGGGNGWGNGYGCSNGYGDGYGWSDSDGNGRGCGFGFGFSDDDGNGWGNGRGNSREITEINGMKTYVIDRVKTVIETVFGVYAKGYIVGRGFTLTPCYIAMDGFSFAHGKTLKEAFHDARVKEIEKLPEDERVKRFIAEHPDPNETLTNEKLFYIHHTLTGSCEFGRREFCKANGISLESSMNISEFIALTENEFGGHVIKKVKEEYLHQAKTIVSKLPIFAS